MAKLKYLEHADEVLVALTLSGDQNAYEALVARHERSVMAAARRITCDDYLAEDASQEAFVSAWIKLDCLREPARFGAWVRRIARNCAVDMIGRLRDYVSYDVLENAVGTGNCDMAEDNEDERSEVIDQLRESIGRLPERVRTIITLHYFEGVSVADIAQRLGIAVGTVKWQLHDGRERIRKDMGVMDNKLDKTLVERVMEEVEKLKLWRLKNDKTGFSSAYAKTLRAVEDLPECRERDHAMADVLMQGFWWLPGERNDELLARMKEYALKGHNDEVMASVCLAEDAKIWHPDSLIKWMRETQIPYLEEHGFVKALGREWYRLGLLYGGAGGRKERLAAWQRAKELLSFEDDFWALVQAAERAEGLYWEKREARGSDQWFLITGSGQSLRVIDGELRSWSQEVCEYGHLWNAIQQRNHIFFTASYGEFRCFVPGAKLGDVYTGTDSSTLTLAATGDCVKTPAGVFEECDMWETLTESLLAQTWYADGVGIVKQRVRMQGEWSERVLKAYTVVGGSGKLPLAVGNRWEYVGDEDAAYVVADMVYEVTYADDGRATLSGNTLYERLAYSENSWNDMVLQMRSDYVRREGWQHRLCDVSAVVDRAEALAKTPYEVAYSRAACSVMRRIMATDRRMSPEREAIGHWNFFNVYCLKRAGGRLMSVCDHRSSRSFEWKNTWELRDHGKPLLYNHMLGILQDATGCLWSDEWKDGYSKVIEHRLYRQDVKTRLSCRDVGQVATAAGCFDGCLTVAMEVEGMPDGKLYRGGKHEYTFAPGIGIVRAVFHYKGDSLKAVYELASYRGTGEGYMPMCDGMDRRYEAVGLTGGFVAWTDCAVRERADGELYLILDLCGIRELPPYDENNFESMAAHLHARYETSDVSGILARCEALAATPYQKAHARMAANAIGRIMDTDEEKNPNRTHSGHRNRFGVRYLVERGSRMDWAEGEMPYAIMRDDMRGTGDWGAPMFFNNLFGIWADAVDGFWNSILTPGAVATLKHKRHGYDVTTELSCREVGSVTTEAATFMNCLEVAVEITGMPYEISYHNGTKRFYFAPGVGMVRAVQDHKDHTLQGIYDLVAYEGEGEGYMPLCEGMTRRYEAQFMREGYTASAEYAVERDSAGRLCLIENRCGIKKL